MGCFGSKSPKEVESNTIQINLIALNFQKLSHPPPSVFESEVMKPIRGLTKSISIRSLKPSQLEDLKNLNFPVFTKTPEYLKSGIKSILSTRYFNNPNLNNLIETISLNYQDNPFHNFYHGFSVFQLLFVISERNQQLSSFLTENDERLLLLSGLGHDLNHPGVNNAFMVNTKHEIALRFNNQAVLENYHAATLIEFLRTFDIGVSENDRQVILTTILGTDMTQHKSVMENYAEIQKNYDKNNPDHVLHFMRMAIHAADVGNPALEFDLATIWSLKIIQEFNLQVWKEEKAEVQVSEFMRIGSDMEKIKKSQIGFIDFIILPLWKSLSGFIPNTMEMVQNIEKNRKHWEEIENL
jgi:hypothetical protein